MTPRPPLVFKPGEDPPLLFTLSSGAELKEAPNLSLDIVVSINKLVNSLKDVEKSGSQNLKQQFNQIINSSDVASLDTIAVAKDILNKSKNNPTISPLVMQSLLEFVGEKLQSKAIFDKAGINALNEDKKPKNDEIINLTNLIDIERVFQLKENYKSLGEETYPSDKIILLLEKVKKEDIKENYRTYIESLLVSEKAKREESARTVQHPTTEQKAETNADIEKPGFFDRIRQFFKKSPEASVSTELPASSTPPAAPANSGTPEQKNDEQKRQQELANAAMNAVASLTTKME